MSDQDNKLGKKRLNGWIFEWVVRNPKWSRKKAKQAIRLFEQYGYWEDPDTKIGYDTQEKLKQAFLDNMDNLAAIEVLSKYEGWL